MSAYLCDSAHISACACILHNLAASPYWQGPGRIEGRTDSPENLFALLLCENVMSLQERYPGSRDMWQGAEAYQFQPVSLPAHLAGMDSRAPLALLCQCLKALQCYEYQSCEHDSWHGTTAYRMVYEAIRTLALQIARTQQEYEQADWGWRPQLVSLAGRR